MGYFIVFILSGITTIIPTFFFLILKLGPMGAIKTIMPIIIQTIFYLVIIVVMFYILCLVLKLIYFLYKKIKNFVKKLLTNKK